MQPFCEKNIGGDRPREFIALTYFQLTLCFPPVVEDTASQFPASAAMLATNWSASWP